MRLSVIFVGVLALAVMVTSMAAWGMTYGTSSARVSSMASQFLGLAHRSLGVFNALVEDVLDGNAKLVNTLLDVQQNSSIDGMEQTKAQISHDIGTLVNYTTNATIQTQQMMNEVVGEFSGLINTVVAQFKDVAASYAAQLRIDLAEQSGGTLAFGSDTIDLSKIALQSLVDIGLVDLSRAPTDPVSAADCTLLALLWDMAQLNVATPFYLQSETGRLYVCSGSEGCMVSVMSSNGAVYNESHLYWRPYPAAVPASARNSTQQRCLAEPPEVVVVGRNCPLPRSCQCGADQRCSTWYQAVQQRGAAAPHSVVTVAPDDAGVVTLFDSLAIVDSSLNPTKLLGGVQNGAPLAGVDDIMHYFLGPVKDTNLALLWNDTNLTLMGSTVGQCASAGPLPGDPSLPVWSSLRTCDLGLRTVAQRVFSTRPITKPFSMEAAGLLWDISLVETLVGDYFLVMSSNASVVNQPIDAAVAAAASQLAVARANLINESALRGAETLSYMNKVASSDIQHLQAMQDNFQTQFQTLKTSSEALLNASQVGGSTDANRASDAQAMEADQLKAAQIRKMNTMAGLTVGVVFGILLVVVCLSTWGTVHITTQLSGVIRMMEDVAQMRVENLSMPQGSSVQEVARIKAAFKLVQERLAEYKSYIPASVFEQLGGEQAGSPPKLSVAHSCDSGSWNDDPRLVAAAPSSEALSACSASNSWQATNVQRGLIAVHRRNSVEKKHVAVLCVNVEGISQGLCDGSGWVDIFNEYLSCLHKVSTQALGNLDFLTGDQAFVTFNAFVNCTEPVIMAAQVACDVQRLFSSQVSGRLKFQLGLSFGSAICSTVGYAKFKTMVTLGTPMKTASLLSQLDGFENAAILADASFQERAKHSFAWQPVDLLDPLQRELSIHQSRNNYIFKILGKKNQESEEWVYEIPTERSGVSNWEATFDELVAAPSDKVAQDLLQQYLASHPSDAVALRLGDHLHRWFPQPLH